MRLEIQRGKEHKLVLSEDILNPDEFMYPAFQQAIRALQAIVAQAREFNEEGENDLFGYSHNIIAFSGLRGQGKTSTMLSFSRALEQKKVLHELGFFNCVFEVLPPMDPTILEEKQSILGVVLSRMYRKAENAWRDSARSNNSMHVYSNTEADKNELLMLFQKCLSGINAIKFQKGEEIRSLSEIHEISDSSVLKENICKLIKKLLRFCGKNGENSFLVIQLDDTDFQLRKSYEVLEDIRKFLSIPNVVILMATDIDLLRILITQHYIDGFEKSLNHKLVNPEYLQKLEAKYLDKLMPPTHVVYLPQLEETILRHGDSLDLVYIDISDGEKIDLLRPKNAKKTEQYPFQSLILRYVYRKTGIVFAEPTSYMHNLIPTTFRGLMQFLSFLSSMEDVPVIQEEDKKEPKRLREALGKRVAVLETNLQLFENYFINDWVSAKLPEKKGDIKRLREAVSEEKYGVAKSMLDTYYKPEDPYRADYGSIIDCIEQLSKKNRSVEDFCFFFTIHAYFTIENNKAVLRQIKKEASKKTNDLVIFDFTPEATNLPNCYPKSLTRETDISSYNEGRIGKSKALRDYENLPGLVRKCIEKEGGSTGKVNNGLMSYVMGALALGSPDLRKGVNKETKQESIYDAQIAAAVIAANWDVQHKLENISKDLKISYDTTLTFWMNQIDTVLCAINSSAIAANSMFTVCFAAFAGVLSSFSNTTNVESAGTVLKDESNVESELLEMYSAFQSVKDNFSDKEQVREVYYSNFTDWMSHTEKDISDLASDLAFMLEDDSTNLQQLSQSFDVKFGEICSKRGISYKQIKEKQK